MKKALVAVIGIGIAIAIGYFLYTQMSVMMPANNGSMNSSASSDGDMFESSSSAAMMEGSVKMNVTN